MARVSVSTHVLDTERGRPAAGVRVELYDAGGELVADAVTDSDGRIAGLAEADAGAYRLVFHPPSPFFTQVSLEVALEDGHYHVPLLISSYGCASYRGS
jgi:5-hydroxyisourate hydrolase